MITKADRLLKDIDNAIAPPMSEEEALSFLEHIQDGVEAKIDGLKEDIRRKE